MARRRRQHTPAPLFFPPDIQRDRERSCTSKDAYPTEAHARSVAAMNGLANALVTYRCRYCDLWHLTRRRKPENEEFLGGDG
ncbi:MAG: hypothetical protein ACXVAM_00115 [Vulcanimicrobiaceae bacterium]